MFVLDTIITNKSPLFLITFTGENDETDGSIDQS